MGGELYVPCRQREKRIITAPAHVETRMEPGAPLANDDCPGIHQLATEALETETLRIGIAPVSRTSDAFLMCHSKNLSKQSLCSHDFLDEHLRIGLTVPPKAPIPFPPLLLEHENFRIARMIQHFGLTLAPSTTGLPTVILSPSERRRTSPRVVTVPISPGIRGRKILSPGATLACTPATRTTACMIFA